MNTPQELVLISAAPYLAAHDLLSGSQLLSFKPSQAHLAAQSKASKSSTTDGLVKKLCAFAPERNGLPAMVCSLTSAGRGQASYYSFQKEAPVSNCILPERLTTVAVSYSGLYLAGGSEDGRLWLWQLSTGALLNVFDAHYKAISCLAWTRDDGGLISGGEDGIIQVYSLAAMTTSTNAQPSRFNNLQDHALAITDLAVGFGQWPTVRVVSSSLDGTCKIWDISSTASPLLATMYFPPDSQVLKVALDPLERFYFAAHTTPDLLDKTKKTHAVLRVDLARSNGETLLDSALNLHERQQVGQGDNERSFVTSDVITALHISELSSHLLVAAADKVHILALPSLQNIKTITVPSTNAITSLLTLLRPPDMVTSTMSKKSGPQVAIDRWHTLQQAKETDASLKQSYSQLGKQPRIEDVLMPPRKRAGLVQDTQPLVASANMSSPVHAVDQDMADELLRTKDQLARALKMNEEMWQNLVNLEAKMV